MNLRKHALALICATSFLAFASNPDPATAGIYFDNMDHDVRPQDDFFQFVNGNWINHAEIPGDRPATGAFFQLLDDSEANQLNILKSLEKESRAQNSPEQRLHDLFTSFMNVETIEKVGASAVKDTLKRIDQIKTKKDLIDTFSWFSRIGIGHPSAVFVMADVNDTEKNIMYLTQSGLTLPDRDYYIKDDGKLVETRNKMPAYADSLFSLAEVAEKPGRGARILDFETKLAHIQWPASDVQNIDKTNNPTKVSELKSYGDHLRLGQYVKGLKAPTISSINIGQPSYFRALDQLISETPIDTIKEYLYFRVLDDAAPHLSKAFVDVEFDFNSRVLSGLSQQADRWKRAVRVVNGSVGESMGQLYVAQYFPPESKRRMEELVDNLLLAMKGSINELDWMSADTKERAQEKLAKVTTHIGYPDKWKSYDGLVIKAGDHYGNVMRSRAWHINDGFQKLNKPVDRTEWGMTPQTVNAYYSPVHNKVVFPAAILQPPFFDPNAGDEVNYGAIGAVIGHEISHGFDDQGRKFDGQGNVNDWWTKDDNEAFEKRANVLIEHFNGFEALTGLHLNGELTLGENIGDLSGLTIAYRAYRASINDKELPVLNDYSGDQRFFIGFGQIWRVKLREQFLRMLVISDEHAPPMFRVNGTLANMPEFHQAFKVGPGDKLYRAPKDVVKIW